MSKFIPKLEKIKTPFYFYDVDLFKNTLKLASNEANRYGFKVHYAIKANYNPKILRIVKQYGFGADCVSGQEIMHVLNCGYAPEDIVFAGVGKADEEIEIALDNNIFCFNCESLEELKILNYFAAKKKKKINIALRIIPNIDANTYDYITTGMEENKFGISYSLLPKLLRELKELTNLNVFGLHFHLGSQITNLAIFHKLCIRVNELQKWFSDRGYKFYHINVGGGLGINYENPDKYLIPCFKKFFNIFHQHLNLHPHQKLHFELGRSLVGQCGTLISKVLYVKKGINKNFVILDAGMNDLLRPALYRTTHKIENLVSQKENKKYDVVGPVCETSCTFGKEILLPVTNQKDLIAIRSVGAYGEVMASRYNLRKIPLAYYSNEI